MSIAPVNNSTISPGYLNELLQKDYSLSNNSTCNLFRTGINHTYIVTDSDNSYALRVYSINWRTKQEIEEEIRLLNLLKDGGISVSYAVSDNNSNYIKEIHAPEGLRYAVLFTFAKGNKVRHMSEQTCEDIGYAMAKMHELTIKEPINRVNYTSDNMLHWAYNQVAEHFDESLEEMQYLKKLAQLISPVLDSDSINIRNGIVHLDLWYDNMAINDNGSFTFFDFDNCGNGKLALDVGYFLMMLFDIEFNKPEFERKAEHFLNGYQKISKLSDEETKALPYLGCAIWIFYLGVQANRFDWSNIFYTENYLKMYVARIKRWVEYNKIEVY